MVALTKKQTLAVSAMLILPASFIVVSGLLDVLFDVEGLDRLFGAMNSTLPGAILFSPPVVLGAAAVAVLLNLSRFCRIWFGPDRGTINLSVSFGGSTQYLVAATTACAVAGILMLYGAKYAIRAAVLELMR